MTDMLLRQELCSHNLRAEGQTNLSCLLREVV